MKISIEDLFTPTYEEYIRNGAARLEAVLNEEESGKNKRSDIESDIIIRTDTTEHMNMDVLREILVYITARIGASVIADPLLIRRYSLHESKVYNARLDREEKDVLIMVAFEMGLEVMSPEIVSPGALPLESTSMQTPERGSEETLCVSAADYLAFTGDMRSEPDWKLTRQELVSGYVLLPQKKISRIVENLIYKRFETDLPLPVSKELVNLFEPYLKGVRASLESLKAKFRRTEITGVDAGAFPPCMKNLIQKAHSGENIVHSGRFALTAFLNRIGMSPEEILKLFASSPDFRADIAQYQINHITGVISGTVYNVPECRTMVAYGLCVNKDTLCEAEWLSRPLQYYRYKMNKRLKNRKTQQKEEEK